VETFRGGNPTTTYNLTRESPIPKQIEALKKLLGPKYADVETSMDRVTALKTTAPLTETEKKEILKITAADKVEEL